MSVGAILLCAGRGERLGAGVEKALVPLAGRPLFVWSLEALQRTPEVEGIVIVGPRSRLEPALAAAGVAPARVAGWTEGGPTRQDSVSCGLRALPAGFTWVALHDCARALVRPDLIARVIADARSCGAAIAAMPVEDTLKRVEGGVIGDTVERAGLWRAQTPQVFRRDWLEEAHARASAGATDDAALLEAAGHEVKVTEGDALNLKITTAADLELAEAWIAARGARA